MGSKAHMRQYYDRLRISKLHPRWHVPIEHSKWRPQQVAQEACTSWLHRSYFQALDA